MKIRTWIIKKIFTKGIVRLMGEKYNRHFSTRTECINFLLLKTANQKKAKLLKDFMDLNDFIDKLDDTKLTWE